MPSAAVKAGPWWHNIAEAAFAEQAGIWWKGSDEAEEKWQLTCFCQKGLDVGDGHQVSSNVSLHGGPSGHLSCRPCRAPALLQPA